VSICIYIHVVLEYIDSYFLPTLQVSVTACSLRIGIVHSCTRGTDTTKPRIFFRVTISVSRSTELGCLVFSFNDSDNKSYHITPTHAVVHYGIGDEWTHTAANANFGLE